MSKIFDKARRFAKVILPLIIVTTVFALIGSTGLVSAGEESLESRLSGYGLAEVSVSLSGNEVTVSYTQRVSEMSSVSDQLAKIAIILSYVAEELPGVVQVRVEQHFDDGQIMEISGSPADGRAFLNGQLSEEDFMYSLEFNPLTRGPLIMPGECEPGRGENCENCPECGCYPNERCEPANPQANEQGCVVVSVPANAHLEGSQYVCNDGYEWNQELTGCVPEKRCPPNAFKFQGECYCNPGYQWDAAGETCVPIEETEVGGPSSTTSEVGLLEQLQDLLNSLIKPSEPSSTTAPTTPSQQPAQQPEQPGIHIAIADGKLTITIKGKGEEQGTKVEVGAPQCFIATAAYGTPTAEEIDVLRDFRDEVLLQHPAGRKLISLYYEWSPPLADFISKHELCRTVIREVLLDPLVTLINSSRALWDK